jgi:hypothetical protein
MSNVGTWIQVEGKLRRTKRGEHWETVLATFEAQPRRIAPGVVGEGRAGTAQPASAKPERA